MAKESLNTHQLKDELLSVLKSEHPTMCRRWFNEMRVVGVVDGSLVVQINEPVQLKYLQRCCVDQFIDAAQTVTQKLLGVRFVGEEGLESTADNSIVVMGDVHYGNSSNPYQPIDEDMLICPDFNFENFIVGPGNRLAHAAATAVATKPGQAYNPLFIHGGVGLGKTHLLQSICQIAMRKHRSMKIYYVSCNGFMTQFLGGPMLYNEKYGHPRMRMRHMPHKIPPEGMGAWLENIKQAIMESTLQEELKGAFFNSLPKLAAHMVNSSEES